MGCGCKKKVNERKWKRYGNYKKPRPKAVPTPETTDNNIDNKVK